MSHNKNSSCPADQFQISARLSLSSLSRIESLGFTKQAVYAEAPWPKIFIGWYWVRGSEKFHIDSYMAKLLNEVAIETNRFSL